MAKPRGWGPWTQIKLDALEMLGYPVNFQPSKRDQFSASTHPAQSIWHKRVGRLPSIGRR